MKRPDRKDMCLLAALLLAVGAAGCGGMNATVPISPLMFIQNRPAQPVPATPAGVALALNDVPQAGQ